ncbi:MAG: hypothetical protein KDA42_00775 [Planctomycetales bacterium]|nr:hypothetical protein [Planctomycetales bacterium]
MGSGLEMLVVQAQMRFTVRDLLIVTAIGAVALRQSIFTEHNQNLIFFNYRYHCCFSMAVVAAVVAIGRHHLIHDGLWYRLREKRGLGIAACIATVVWIWTMLPFYLAPGIHTNNIFNNYGCLQWWYCVFGLCIGILFGIGCVQVGTRRFRSGIICLASAIGLGCWQSWLDLVTIR